MGVAGGYREVVLNATEAAIALTVTDPGLRLPDSIGVGGTISKSAGGPGPEIVVYITRLDSTTYSVLAESVSESGSGGSAHRVGVVVRSSIADDDAISIVPISERAWFEVF